MVLPEFNFHQPVSVKEAFAFLEKGDTSVVMAGGTDLLVEMKKGLRKHTDIISLAKIKKLKRITKDKENIYIGACVTHNEIIADPVIKKFVSALKEATSKIGSEQVRNTGTIGGNICTAASCCDTAPVLLALNASVEIINRQESKILPLKDFFVFNKKTILNKGDIMTRIIIPKPVRGTGAAYEKFGLREAGSIAVVSVAAMVVVKDSMIEDACIVIGAVAPTPKISSLATQIIKGRTVSELLQDKVLQDEVGNAAVNDSIPIDDIRGGAQYRRDVLKVLTVRAIIRAINQTILK